MCVMMDRSIGAQQKYLLVTMESLMPEKHFLRDLDRLVDFSFVYEKVEHLYSASGRRSIDPVVIVKMMLLGYLYGINSERRLEQEVQVNIAYRWFLGIDLNDTVPDHSTFSQLRRRKFNGSAIFEDIFTKIVRRCMEYGLIDGKLLLTDSTHVRANVRNDIVEQITVDAEPAEYPKRLNEEAKQEGIYPQKRKSSDNDMETPEKKQTVIRKSPTDPDCGFMNRPGKPLGFHYLSHETCDSKHGLITDVYVTPGNVNDSTVHSSRIQYQIEKFGFPVKAVCADKGYDSTEIHYDMLHCGIKTFIPKKAARRTAKGIFCADDFQYDPETDSLICPNNIRMPFLSYSPKAGTKRYTCTAKDCEVCPLRAQCITGKAPCRQIDRAYHKYEMDVQHLNDNTPEFREAMRLRQIYCEGNFSHQKAKHNLTRLRMWGIGKAFEHCLLSATALNLKRMIRLLTRQSDRSEILDFYIGGHFFCKECSLLYAALSTAPQWTHLCLYGNNKIKNSTTIGFSAAVVLFFLTRL